MLDHIDFDTANFEVSRDFYIACLAPLGIGLVLEHRRHAGLAGAGFGRDQIAQFFIGEGKAVSGRLHFAFEAQSREAVDSFYREALRAGAKSKGEPGIRTRYAPNWYAAFVYDPDGHTVEAIYRIPADSESPYLILYPATPGPERDLKAVVAPACQSSLRAFSAASTWSSGTNS